MQESSSYTNRRCKVTHTLLGDSGSQIWYSENHLKHVKDDSTPPPMSKCRILKNVTVTSAAHFLLYQTTLTLANLQSTLNADGGVGVGSMAVQYGMAMVGIVLFSDILLKIFGCKKMLVLLVVLELPYFASNFYPKWETLLPTSVLAGSTLGLTLVGFSLYINEMSVLYHSTQDSGHQSLEAITSRFFGIFTFFTLNSSIWFNVLSYYLFRPDSAVQFNHTNASCGIDFEFSSMDDNDNLLMPSREKKDILVTVCLSSAVLCVLLLVAFVDELDLKVDQAMAGRSRCQSFLMSLSATVRQIFVRDQWLLLPFAVYFGVQKSFFSADFTKAYIACSWGVYHIGMITMFYGACGAAMGFVIGSLVNRTSQIFLTTLGIFLNLFVFIFLCGWNPSPDFVEAYFIVAGIWGAYDAIWWVQISAVYGLLFPQGQGENFSFMYLCVLMGFTFTFSTSNNLSIRIKVALNFIFLIIGLVGYLTAIIKVRRAEKRKRIII